MTRWACCGRPPAQPRPSRLAGSSRDRARWNGSRRSAEVGWWTEPPERLRPVRPLQPGSPSPPEWSDSPLPGAGRSTPARVLGRRPAGAPTPGRTEGAPQPSGARTGSPGAVLPRAETAAARHDVGPAQVAGPGSNRPTRSAWNWSLAAPTRVSRFQCAVATVSPALFVTRTENYRELDN